MLCREKSLKPPESFKNEGPWLQKADLNIL